MSNFVQVEPLSVTAFARAMLDAVLNDHVLDIGANMGFYTTLAADVSPNRCASRPLRCSRGASTSCDATSGSTAWRTMILTECRRSTDT